MRGADVAGMITLACVACPPSGPPSPAPSAPGPVAVVLDSGSRAPVADAAVAAHSQCDGLRAEQSAADKHARAAGFPATASRFLSPVRMPCAAFSGGAWGIVARIDDSARSHALLRWDLVAVRSGARKARPLFAQELDKDDAGDDGRTEAPFACDTIEAFDYDGDGVPEVLAPCSGGPEAKLVDADALRILWTMAGGDIQPYVAARGVRVEHLRDIDGDGRPDLEYSYFGGVARYYIADRLAGPVSSPTLIAHALSGGTFAKDDAVAINRVKKLCPKHPAQLLGPGSAGNGSRVEVLTRNVACARFWGATRAAVLASVKRECDAYWKIHSQEDGREHDPCLSVDLIELYASDPPLVLR